MQDAVVANQIASAFAKGDMPGLLISGKVFWITSIHTFQAPQGCTGLSDVKATLETHAKRVPGRGIYVDESPTEDFCIEGHIRVDSRDHDGMGMRLAFSADQVAAVYFEINLS